MIGSRKEIDKLASNRLKQRRLLLGMSQKELGQAIDITPQQIKKYEEGLSNIPVSRLYIFSKILNTPLRYFLDDRIKEYPENEIEYQFEELKTDMINNVAEETIAYSIAGQNEIFSYRNLSTAMEKEIFSLTKAFVKVQSPSVRKSIIEFVKTVSVTSR